MIDSPLSTRLRCHRVVLRLPHTREVLGHHVATKQTQSTCQLSRRDLIRRWSILVLALATAVTSGVDLRRLRTPPAYRRRHVRVQKGPGQAVTIIALASHRTRTHPARRQKEDTGGSSTTCHEGITFPSTTRGTITTAGPKHGWEKRPCRASVAAGLPHDQMLRPNRPTRPVKPGRQPARLRTDHLDLWQSHEICL